MPHSCLWFLMLFISQFAWFANADLFSINKSCSYFQVFIDELRRIFIKCKHLNQHLIIPNNNYQRVQTLADHHLHAQQRNEDFFLKITSLVLIFCFSSVYSACSSPLLSISVFVVVVVIVFVSLALLVLFFLYHTAEKRDTCIIVRTIVCFHDETNRIFSCVWQQHRRPVNSVWSIVVDLFFFHQSSSSSCVYVCVCACIDTHLSFQAHTHAHTYSSIFLVLILIFFWKFSSSCYLFVVLLMLIIVLSLLLFGFSSLCVHTYQSLYCSSFSFLFKGSLSSCQKNKKTKFNRRQWPSSPFSRWNYLMD